MKHIYSILLYNNEQIFEEQGERFHQNICEMESRYKGRWNANMMADYCWSLKRHIPGAVHSRKSRKRQFLC